MVIDADEFLGDAIRWLITAVLIGLCLLVAGAVIVARLVHGKVTGKAVALGAVITMSAAVLALVVWRLLKGMMTGYDSLWALGATVVGASAYRSLRANNVRPNATHRSVPPGPTA